MNITHSDFIGRLAQFTYAVIAGLSVGTFMRIADSVIAHAYERDQMAAFLAAVCGIYALGELLYWLINKQVRFQFWETFSASFLFVYIAVRYLVSDGNVGYVGVVRCDGREKKFTIGGRRNSIITYEVIIRN